MYTYLISIAVFFLISAMIYRKKIQQNIFSVILIVVAGSFISTAVVNGIFANSVKYEKTMIRHNVYMPKNRTFYFNDTIKVDTFRLGNYIGRADIATKDRNLKEGQYTIYFKDKNDTLTYSAYFNKYKDVPVSNSKWLSTLGMPRKNLHWDIFLPDDSINRAMVAVINENIRKYHENESN